MIDVVVDVAGSIAAGRIGIESTARLHGDVGGLPQHFDGKIPILAEILAQHP
jgi:hypothetical protein